MKEIKEDSSWQPLIYNCDVKKKVVCSLISQDNDCSMGYTFMRCEVATFPIWLENFLHPSFATSAQVQQSPRLACNSSVGHPAACSAARALCVQRC